MPISSINLDSEISSYFLERLQVKRDLSAAIWDEYPLSIGTTFEDYGNSINDIYGNDVAGHVASEALIGGMVDGAMYTVSQTYGNQESYVYANDYYGLYAGLLRNFNNRRNANAELSFPGITELSIDSDKKFAFWFIGGNEVGSVTFPDLSAIYCSTKIKNNSQYPKGSGRRHAVLFGSYRVYLPNLVIAELSSENGNKIENIISSNSN